MDMNSSFYTKCVTRGARGEASREGAICAVFCAVSSSGRSGRLVGAAGLSRSRGFPTAQFFVIMLIKTSYCQQYTLFSEKSLTHICYHSQPVFKAKTFQPWGHSFDTFTFFKKEHKITEISS